MSSTGVNNTVKVEPSGYQPFVWTPAALKPFLEHFKFVETQTKYIENALRSLQSFVSVIQTKHRQVPSPLPHQPILDSHRKKKASCDICKYSSDRVSHVKRHILRKHAKMKLPCPNCHKSFNSYDNLKRHQQTTKKCINKSHQPK